jgi:hypothetical protein
MNIFGRADPTDCQMRRKPFLVGGNRDFLQRAVYLFGQKSYIFIRVFQPDPKHSRMLERRERAERSGFYRKRRLAPADFGKNILDRRDLPVVPIAEKPQRQVRNLRLHPFYVERKPPQLILALFNERFDFRR